MWDWKIMGITDLPYHACQAVTGAKCIAMEDRLESNNPFAWENVVMELPGTEEYDYQSTWVFKKRFDGLLAVEFFIYVEKGWLIGPTENLCWEASIIWGSTCSWLGIQDASRKVQPP